GPPSAAGPIARATRPRTRATTMAIRTWAPKEGRRRAAVPPDIGLDTVLPIERQRRLAEGETVEVAGHHVLHPFGRLAVPGLDRDDQGLVLGRQCDEGVGKAHRAMVRGETDLQLVAPVLAQLLEIFAGAFRRHARDGEGHVQSL